MKRKENGPRRKRMPRLTPKDTEAIICRIALQEGTSVEMVRKHIQVAMIAGMMNSDPTVRAVWEKIPRMGEVLTPEEVIAHYSNSGRKWAKTENAQSK